MGVFKDGDSGQFNHVDLLYYKTITRPHGYGTNPLGINPKGKTVCIHKIIVSCGQDIQYILQDSGKNSILPPDSSFHSYLFLDLGYSTIQLKTVDSDLYLQNLTATATTFSVHIWYTLE